MLPDEELEELKENCHQLMVKYKTEVEATFTPFINSPKLEENE